MATKYSASVVERTTSLYNFERQLTGPFTSVIGEPDAERLPEVSATKSASVYASSCGFDLVQVYVRPRSGSFAIYLIT